jgi:CBS-domain-containing membrane protein
VAILIVTVGGEIEALVSLSVQRAYGDPHAAIAAAVLLTAAAAVGPALAFARLMVTLYPRRHKSGSPSPAGEADSARGPDLHAP